MSALGCGGTARVIDVAVKFSPFLSAELIELEGRILRIEDETVSITDS